MSKVRIALKIAPGRSIRTPEQRRHRDVSVWTDVQVALSPLRFLLFRISLIRATRYLRSGKDSLATISTALNTLTLYPIGCCGRTERVDSDFYISQALELHR